jgi:hypothetical protein
MPTVKIEGCGYLDGEYPLDLNFTHRDFREIKQISGIRANEVQEALAAGDLDVVVAIAAISMRKNNKRYEMDDLWDTEAGAISLEMDEEEEEEVPLTMPPPSGSNEGGESNDSLKTHSGLSTSTSMGPSPETSPQPDSGTQQPENGSVLPT